MNLLLKQASEPMKTIPFCRRTVAVPARFLSRAALVGVALALSGCMNQPPRSAQTLPPIDVKTMATLNANVAAESAKLAAAEDEIQRLVEQKRPAPIPEPIAPRHDPLEDVVVSVNLQNADLASILQVLSAQARMNMLVDPEVLSLDKRASLYLNHVTARELYRNILDTFDLAGQTEGSTIRIGLYEERFFAIDFLNSRMNVDISAGGNVFGSNTSGGGGSSSGGSSGSGGDLIRGNISLSGGTGKAAEPYDQLEVNLKRILGGSDVEGAQQTDRESEKRHTLYSLNRSSGTLFVRARPSQMRVVEKLVDRYKSVLKRQVLIEAQLLDIELNDSFQYGVDWNLLRQHVAGVVGSAPAIASAITGALPGATALPIRALTFPAINVGVPGGNSGGLAYSDKNVAVAINLLRGFGNVKMLSNPSIRARNNSPALLSVGTSSRFVAKSAVTTSNPGGGASTVSSDVQTDSVFSGVIVGVVPFISENGDVELLVHPMQTEVDPNSLQLLDVGGGNKVTLPVVAYKGMTTTLNMHDGDTVIMGGLVDQKTTDQDSGVPGLSDVPIAGKAFGNQSMSHNSRELVMVLRVRVL